MPKVKLTGQKLADVYAYQYALALQKIADVSEIPTVYANYIGGGWINIWGSDLPPAKKMRDLYPNGWCLSATVRSGKARAFVNNPQFT